MKVGEQKARKAEHVIDFIAKRLNHEKKLGDRLRGLREERRLKISALSEALHIPERYLNDIESGCYQNLPEEIYVRNFIRAYARFFSRDCESFLNLYELEIGAAKEKRKEERMVPLVTIKKKDLLPMALLFRLALAGVLCLSLIVYLGYEVKKITSPPLLLVEEPIDNYATVSGEILVKGKSEPESRIRINGEDTLADSLGNFKETVRLQRGLNLIKISASKRRGKERIIYRRVVYEEAVASR